MHFDRKYFPDHVLKQLHSHLLLSRLVEEQAEILAHEGQISHFQSCVGLEALYVGATLALDKDEWIMPLQQGLGTYLSREASPRDVFAYLSQLPFTNPITSSFYNRCIIPAGNPNVANGVALAHKLRREQKVAVTFIESTHTTSGEFHEALTIAAALDLPVVFVVVNNLSHWMSTSGEHSPQRSFADKARAYNIESVTIDANNVLWVYDTMRGVREHCYRLHKPYLVECVTFRRSEYEQAKANDDLHRMGLPEWTEKDPLNYQDYLVYLKLLHPDAVAAMTATLTDMVSQQMNEALSRPPGFVQPQPFRKLAKEPPHTVTLCFAGTDVATVPTDNPGGQMLPYAPQAAAAINVGLLLQGFESVTILPGGNQDIELTSIHRQLIEATAATVSLLQKNAHHSLNYRLEQPMPPAVTSGDDLTLITFSPLAALVTHYTRKNPGTSLQVVVLQTVFPLQRTAVQAAVARTGKVLVWHTVPLRSLALDVCALVAAHCFEHLDAPVAVSAAPDLQGLHRDIQALLQY